MSDGVARDRVGDIKEEVRDPVGGVKAETREMLTRVGDIKEEVRDPVGGDGFNPKAREMLPRLPMILPPEILEKSRSDQIDVAKENIFTPEFKERFSDHWLKMGLEGGSPPIADDLHQIGFGSFFNLALDSFNRGAAFPLSDSASPHAGDGFNSKAREMLPRLPMILPPEILEKSRSDQIDVAKENIFTPEFKERFGDHWFKMGLEGGRPPIADDLHQIGFGSFFNLALNCFNRGAALRLSNSASPHAGASMRANAD